jgi:hypothetical protein
MRTAHAKGISLLDNCARNTAQPRHNSTNQIYLPPTLSTDLRPLDLTNTHDVTPLHKIGNGQPHHTTAILKLHDQEIREP